MKRLVTVNPGETLMDSLKRLSISLDAPCGGHGLCGKCRVKIESGRPNPPDAAEARFFSAAELAEGWRLACRVSKPGEYGVALTEVGAGAVLTEGSDDRLTLNPMSRVGQLVCPPPSLSDQRADCERAGLDALSLPLKKRLSEMMRAGEVYQTVFDGKTTGLFDSRPGNLGLAVDLGTTTMAAYLIDLDSGEQLACAACMNPQSVFGGDVISRAEYAMTQPDGAQALQTSVVSAIRSLLDETLAAAGCGARDARHIVVVGNTVMMHLLTGLTPRYIAASPFTPVYSRAFSAEASEIGLELPGVMVTFGPCVAGYVGADTVSAALSCGMDQTDDLTLLIDIGTNGELALGDRNGLACCAAAAGPAFEGASIRCGCGARPGAIDNVRLEKGEVLCTTIGGAEPSGICGSGLVDAVAQMLEKGVIDDTGRMDPGEMPGEYAARWFRGEGFEAFLLTGTPEKGVFITQQDIREIQLAKSAIAAGIDVLLNETGHVMGDIRRLCLAGGFGNYIRRESAAAIGLLPSELLKRIDAVGNAAGDGAKRMLADAACMTRAEQLRRHMRYVELSARADFQDAFVDHMFFE